MIVRTWSAVATRDGEGAYLLHFRHAVAPALGDIPGFLGATVLRRREAGEVEIVVQTRWASMDAVRAFAGGDPDHAVVEPGAAAALLRFDDRVRHFEVAHEEPAPHR